MPPDISFNIAETPMSLKSLVTIAEVFFFFFDFSSPPISADTVDAFAHFVFSDFPDAFWPF